MAGAAIQNLLKKIPSSTAFNISGASPFFKLLFSTLSGTDSFTGQGTNSTNNVGSAVSEAAQSHTNTRPTNRRIRGGGSLLNGSSGSLLR